MNDIVGDPLVDGEY